MILRKRALPRDVAHVMAQPGAAERMLVSPFLTPRLIFKRTQTKEGESCIAADQCGAGNVCSLCGVAASSATCLSTRKKSEPCRCSSDCDPNLQCADGVCGPTGRKGDACSDAHPCDAWGGLFCGSSGVCEEYRIVAATEACDVLGGIICSGGNECVHGRCVAQEAAPCTLDRDCLPSQICAEGFCVVATGCG